MEYFVDDLHVLALYFEADSVQCDYMVSEIKTAEAHEPKRHDYVGLIFDTICSNIV